MLVMTTIYIGLFTGSDLYLQELVPSIPTQSQPLEMPILSISMPPEMKSLVEHGIGSIIVFEYLYFLLQVKNRDEQRSLTLAAEEYQKSGRQHIVCKQIEAVFQEHGENVKILCPILVDIAKQNQMSKSLLK